MDLLDNIKHDIDGNIQKNKLEKFLRNDEKIIKQRLSLIKIILECFNPDEVYLRLKRTNKEINNLIVELTYIKDNINKYFKETYKDKLLKITEAIKIFSNNKISDYYGDRYRIRDLDLDKLKVIADKINKVKDFLLFNVIYDMNMVDDEEIRFSNSCKTLDDIGESIKKKSNVSEQFKEIFDKTKEKLDDNEEEIRKFIDDFKDYYTIKDKQLIDEVAKLIKK